MHSNLEASQPGWGCKRGHWVRSHIVGNGVSIPFPIVSSSAERQTHVLSVAIDSSVRRWLVRGQTLDIPVCIGILFPLRVNWYMYKAKLSN